MTANLDDLKRSFGKAQLIGLAAGEGLRHRASGLNRAECPGCRNGDARGASIGETDGVGVWKCHRDETHRGTAIDFLALARSISVADAIGELERMTGSAPTPRPPRASASPDRPPQAEVAALWNACRPVTLDDEVASEWRARGLDVAHVEDRDLARALPRGSLVPGWAGFAGQAWSSGRHRLIVPMFDSVGRLRSLHARAVSGDKRVPKGLSPAGYAVGGLVMADPLGRLMLAAQDCGDGESSRDTVRRCGLVVCEGVPDFLTWATRWGDAAESAPAVFGIISGSWTGEVAGRVPSGTVVYLRTHADPAGAKYATAIAGSLGSRCDVRVGHAAGRAV